MNKNKLYDFGKAVKIRLINMEKSQTWLISEVQLDTGLYFDSSYLSKIMTGKIATPGIIASICKILEIKQPGGE